jgi:hypothetical protein
LLDAAVGVSFLVVVGSGVLVEGACGQDVPGGGQDGAFDRDQGRFTSDFRPGHDIAGVDQHHIQPLDQHTKHRPPIVAGGLQHHPLCSLSDQPRPQLDQLWSPGLPGRDRGRRRPRAAHAGGAKLGARVRPGWFAQTHEHPELVGRTLLEHPAPGRRAPRRDAEGTSEPRAGQVRAGIRVGAAVRHALRRPAGTLPDPAARTGRRNAPPARRADGQPRPGVRRGDGGGPVGVRGHRARRHA